MTILASCATSVYFTRRPIAWARPSTRSRPISNVAPLADDVQEIRALVEAIRRRLARWN